MEGEEIRGMSVVEERESEGESEMGVTDPKESVHDQITSKGIGDKSVRGLQVVISLQEHRIHTRTRVNPQQHRLRYRVCERGTADGLQVRENGWNVS